jgi:hypothetical protein
MKAWVLIDSLLSLWRNVLGGGGGQPPANIYLSCSSVVIHTQGSAAVPHWVHKNTDFFFQRKVFDVSVFTGRSDVLLNGYGALEVQRCYSALIVMICKFRIRRRISLRVASLTLRNPNYYREFKQCCPQINFFRKWLVFEFPNQPLNGRSLGNISVEPYKVTRWTELDAGLVTTVVEFNWTLSS